jgi:two-component system sensor histidine kinase/response regulator
MILNWKQFKSSLSKRLGLRMEIKMKESKSELLIVDDNPENLRVLNSMLQQEGYSVRAAKNAKQALASIGISEPDLVLLDVHMPEMDGFELCKHIKNNSKYQNLPIIFLSALDDTFNKKLGFEAGAVDYMTKPFDIEEVKIRIKTHLKLKASLMEQDRLKAEIAKKNEEIKILQSRLDSNT